MHSYLVGLNFGLGLRQRPYFVCVSSIGSVSAHMPGLLLAFASLISNKVLCARSHMLGAQKNRIEMVLLSCQYYMFQLTSGCKTLNFSNHCLNLILLSQQNDWL